MKCKHCSHKNLIKKGIIGARQRLQCKSCGKYQQDKYIYKLYNSNDDRKIKTLTAKGSSEANAEGLGIRSMSRVLGYSQGTVMRRILFLAGQVTRPIYCQRNQVYEVDEMWTYIGRNHPSKYCWITYAINRRTCEVIEVAVGSRSKVNLKKVIDKVKVQSPKKVVTDKLVTYPNLVKPENHDTKKYSNNRIERTNLTIRTHLKRLFRKTICFSRSKKMLEAYVLLYFDYHFWRLKMG